MSVAIQFQITGEARMKLKSWFTYYNEQRPHQALGMKTPIEVYKLAALLCSFWWIITFF